MVHTFCTVRASIDFPTLIIPKLKTQGELQQDLISIVYLKGSLSGQISTERVRLLAHPCCSRPSSLSSVSGQTRNCNISKETWSPITNHNYRCLDPVLFNTLPWREADIHCYTFLSFKNWYIWSRSGMTKTGTTSEDALHSCTEKESVQSRC